MLDYAELCSGFDLPEGSRNKIPKFSMENFGQRLEKN
jgi:hypothetical protein